VTEDVEHLNYLLQNLVDNALEAISSTKYQDHLKSGGGCKGGFESKFSETNHLSPLKMRCASLTEKIISGNYHSTHSEQSLLDDALLRDTLCQLLYRTYFAGTHFFGVSEDEERVLNTIFETIQSQGKVLLQSNNLHNYDHSFMHSQEPWVAAQRWRSITAAALSKQMKVLSVEVVVQELVQAIKLAHPLKSLHFHRKFTSALQPDTIREMNILAHKLSLTLQRDVVSSVIRVIIAPGTHKGRRWYDSFDQKICRSAWNDRPSKDGDRVLGTYKFGLKRLVKTKEEILIHPEVITDAILQRSN